jgi:chromosome segregation ATPase
MLSLMVQHLSTGYIFDPADPRAPSTEQWVQMSPVDRDRAIALLPSEAATSEAYAREIIEGSSEWRFLPGTTPIERAQEQIAHLESRLNEAFLRNEDAQRRAEELEGKLAEEHRLRKEAEHRLAEALAEIERLKRG